MRRQCVCGKFIQVNRSLCRACLDLYGTDREQWPEWLHFLVNDIQREINTERRHAELAILDDENFVVSFPYGRKIPQPTYSYQLTKTDREAVDANLLDEAAKRKSRYTRDDLSALDYQDDENAAKLQSATIWSMPDRIPNLRGLVRFDELDELDERIDFAKTKAALPDRDRAILTMRADGKTQDEIAAELGISQAMVSKIFNEVIKKLQSGSNTWETDD